jgi:hypothetical protein
MNEHPMPPPPADEEIFLKADPAKNIKEKTSQK